MEIGLSNRFYFYLSMGAKATTAEYTYYLRENIDEEILKLAVKDAMEVFLYFRVKPFLTEAGKLVFQENDAPVPVFKSNGKQVCLGSSDTNGYLFRVVYDGTQIKVSAHHSIGDGRGINAFAQSVVYFYLTRCGHTINPEGKIFTKADINAPTLTDTIVEKVMSMDVPEAITIPENKAEIFYPKHERIYRNTADTRQYRLVWEQDKFRQVVKSYGGTPLTFAHAVIATAMYEYYKLTGERIVANVPVDLRSRLNSRAQSNFTYNVDLDITKEDLTLDMNILLPELRKRLGEVTDINVMLSGLKQMSGFGEELEKIILTDSEMVEQFLDQMFNGTISRTYLLSNIGAVDLPKDMLPFIANIDIDIPVVENTPVFVMFTYENKGTLVIAQNYEADGFIDVLCDKFSAYDINVEIEDCGFTRVDRANALEFDRI